jgi:hypothetical protein
MVLPCRKVSYSTIEVKRQSQLGLNDCRNDRMGYCVFERQHAVEADNVAFKVEPCMFGRCLLRSRQTAEGTLRSFYRRARLWNRMRISGSSLVNPFDYCWRIYRGCRVLEAHCGNSPRAESEYFQDSAKLFAVSGK